MSDEFDLFKLLGGEPEKPAAAPVAASPATPAEVGARAVNEALKARRAAGKRVQSVTVWKKVARNAMGVARLTESAWEAVLDRAYELRLFEVDADSYSYPVLQPMPEEMEAPEPTPEPEPEATEEPEPEPPPKSTINPEVYRVMDCGHYARFAQDGTPATCSHCAEGKKRDYRKATGEWRTPVPMKMRRTMEKHEGPGWPGECYHPETGFYIGGVGNDCRYYQEGDNPTLCPVHQELKDRAAARRTEAKKTRKARSEG